jgi:hypothetical protein
VLTGLAHRVVRPEEIKTKWSGESERNLAKIIKQAATMQPCMLQFDEADGLFGTMEGAGGAGSQHEMQLANVLQQILEYQDLDCSGMIVALTSNRPQHLPLALKSRINISIDTDKLPPGYVWTEQSIGNVIIATLRAQCGFKSLEANAAMRAALGPVTQALMERQKRGQGMDFRRVTAAGDRLRHELMASAEPAPAASVRERAQQTTTVSLQGYELRMKLSELLAKPDVLLAEMPGAAHQSPTPTIAERFFLLWQSAAEQPAAEAAAAAAAPAEPAEQHLQLRISHDEDMDAQLEEQHAHAQEQQQRQQPQQQQQRSLSLHMQAEEEEEKAPAVAVPAHAVAAAAVAMEELSEVEEEHLHALQESSKLTPSQRKRFAAISSSLHSQLCVLKGELILRSDVAATQGSRMLDEFRNIEEAQSNKQIFELLSEQLKLLRVDNPDATMQDIRVDNRPVIFLLASTVVEYTSRPHLLQVFVRRIAYLLNLQGGHGLHDRWMDAEGYNGLCFVLRYANWFPERNELALDDTRAAMRLLIATLHSHNGQQQLRQALELAVINVRDTDCVEFLSKELQVPWTGVARLPVSTLNAFNAAQLSVLKAGLREYRTPAYAVLDEGQLGKHQQFVISKGLGDEEVANLVEDLGNYPDDDAELKTHHAAFVSLVKEHIVQLENAVKGSASAREAKLECLEYIRSTRASTDIVSVFYPDVELPDMASNTTFGISSLAVLPPASIIYMFQFACIHGQPKLAKGIINLLNKLPRPSVSAAR